jgi:hypothetical protein
MMAMVIYIIIAPTSPHLPLHATPMVFLLLPFVKLKLQTLMAMRVVVVVLLLLSLLLIPWACPSMLVKEKINENQIQKC